MDMKTTVTRNGQITIPKKIREKLKIEEGMTLQINLSNHMIVMAKATPEYWKTFEGGFLPDNFEEILKEIRKRGKVKERLKELGII